MNCRFVQRCNEQGRSCHRAERIGGKEGYYALKARKARYGHSSTRVGEAGFAPALLVLIPGIMHPASKTWMWMGITIAEIRTWATPSL